MDVVRFRLLVDLVSVTNSLLLATKSGVSDEQARRESEAKQFAVVRRIISPLGGFFFVDPHLDVQTRAGNSDAVLSKPKARPFLSVVGRSHQWLLVQSPCTPAASRLLPLAEKSRLEPPGRKTVLDLYEG